MFIYPFSSVRLYSYTQFVRFVILSLFHFYFRPFLAFPACVILSCVLSFSIASYFFQTILSPSSCSPFPLLALIIYLHYHHHHEYVLLPPAPERPAPTPITRIETSACPPHTDPPGQHEHEKACICLVLCNV